MKCKTEITVNSPGARNTKDIKKVVPLKYLINIRRTLEMSLTNCEVYLILTSYEDYIISSAKGAKKLKITDKKRYVLVVTVSTQDNAKLWEQLKSDFQRIINCHKY